MLALAAPSMALIAVSWTYTGWVDVTYVASKVRDPNRTFPRAMLGGMAIVVVLYLLVNAAYSYPMPMQAMAMSTLPAATAAERTIGSTGAALILLSTGIIALGSLAYFAWRFLRGRTVAPAAAVADSVDR